MVYIYAKKKKIKDGTYVLIEVHERYVRKLTDFEKDLPAKLLKTLLPSFQEARKDENH